MPRTLSEQEFTAVKQKVLASLPSNLSEDEFQRAVGPKLEAALGEAENSAAPVEGSAVGRFASNLGSMVNPVAIASNVAGAVRHPVNTAKALWDAHVEQYEKAKELAKQGRYVEAAGHTVASVVPILGPMAADTGEQIASGDIAGGLGKATGILAPFAAKYGLELKNAPNPGKADLLRREAETTVSQRVLAPGNPKYRGTAQAIAPQVLERGMQGNRLQLQQLADEGLTDAADKIDAAINSSQASGAAQAIPTKPILDALDARLKSMQVNGQDVPTAAGRVGNLTKLRDYLGKQGQTLSFDQLRTIRDDFYRAAEEAKGYTQVPDQSIADAGWAAREAGGAIRQHLAASVPGLADANADYTFFKRLGDVLDPAIGRPKNVVAAPSGVTGGQSTAGAIVGAAAAAGSHLPVLQGASALVASRLLPALLEARNSPAWQLATAARKMQLADAIERGQMTRAQGLLLQISKAVPVAAHPPQRSQP